MQKDKFSYFVPVEITKSQSEDGEPVMKVKGIASTPDKDSDEEILEPGGFDLSRFLKSGWLNWNHKANTDPSAIVGQPTKAVIQNNQLYIEGFLFPESEKAQEIWALAQVLEKCSPDRRLGYSIEGKVLSRDPNNDKRITKAIITGCAITPTPKNTSTLLEIMKGEGNDFEEIEFELFKSEDPNGGDVELIIDVTDTETGVRRTVDKNLNIKVYKTMTTTAMAPTSREDVEGTRRKYKKDPDEIFKTTFTKSEVYTKIFSMFTSDIEKARDIYGFIEQIQSKLTPNMKTTITSDAIQKAKELFKIVSVEATASEDNKAELQKAQEDEMKKMEEECNDAVKKAEDLKAKIAAAKNQGAKNGEMKKADEETDEKKDDKKDDESVEKAQQSKALSPDKSTPSDSISKAEFIELMSELTKKVNALAVLVTSKDEVIDGLQKSLDSTVEFNSALGRRIGIVEKTPNQPKAITTQNFKERGFGDISKSEQNNGVNGNANNTRALSISRNRKEVVDELYHLSGLEKGDKEKVDIDIMKAMEYVEVTGQIANTEAQAQKIVDKVKRLGLTLIP